MKIRRRQIINDETVQGELIFRAVIYWFGGLALVEAMIFAWNLYTASGQPWAEVVGNVISASTPVVFAAAILLPLILLDVLRVSSRFVGPIQQVRHTLRLLSAGDASRRVYLRRHDFWQELAHYTNLIAYRMEAEEEEPEDDIDYEDIDFPCTDELNSPLEQYQASKASKENTDSPTGAC